MTRDHIHISVRAGDQGHHNQNQGDRCLWPVMSIKAGDSPFGRHSFASPRSGRRVIFPTLNRACPTSQSQPNQGHHGEPCTRKESPAPADFNESAQNTASKNLLLRANSLDGILTRFPGLIPAHAEESKANEPFTPLSHNSKPQGRIRQENTRPFAPISRKRHTFVGTLRHRTYYPAASIPTPITTKKSPSPSQPLTSILRRRVPLSPTTSFQQSAGSPTCSPLPQSSLETSSPSFPPAMPLASPASIKLLQEKTRLGGSDEQDRRIGSSEAGLEQISNVIKILPSKQGSVRRNQSATVVEKGGADHLKPRSCSFDASSHESSVSRHASHECLQNNKRISFDPHITVYEFYDSSGADKWFTEDQLVKFKQEAIHRIRLRSTKLIPRGAGRSLVLTPNQERAPYVNAKPSGTPKQSVFFNHPALGCDDELDESQHLQLRKKSVQEGCRKHTCPSVAHIKNILVVDSDVFLKLFTKSLKVK